MVQAVFIDFYGTVVFEDGEVIHKISQEIFETGIVENKAEIGAYWWNEFQSTFLESYGDNFKTQREIEYQLISETGPAHNRTFVSSVVLDGIVYGTGEGKTKKAAEQEAAKKALEILAGKQ